MLRRIHHAHLIGSKRNFGKGEQENYCV
ncbi:hypothetical protein DSL72_009181 [Monilinia vaccinii-corymbosi]|uniref:Uncharacterized protein n=1 Tax=Monilinia vaccinii-corymbosi TaxID=61207 RepID=A0A8A3PQB4_9HELO|nr:hypothetical protein DSL72_009181 [Monilinia vaccinii-corymbosi]